MPTVHRRLDLDLARVLAMLGAVAFATLAFSRSAAAEPSTRALLGLPLVLGVAHGDRTSLVVGIRPELIVSRLHDDRITPRGPGWGIGAYGEALTLGAHGAVGGGATAIAYGRGLAIAPSIGVYTGSGSDRGVAVSLFAGSRGAMDAGIWDLPIGARLEGRFDNDGNRTVLLTADVDPTVIVIAVAAAIALTHGG